MARKPRRSLSAPFSEQSHGKPPTFSRAPEPEPPKYSVSAATLTLEHEPEPLPELRDTGYAQYNVSEALRGERFRLASHPNFKPFTPETAKAASILAAESKTQRYGLTRSMQASITERRARMFAETLWEDIETGTPRTRHLAREQLLDYTEGKPKVRVEIEAVPFESSGYGLAMAGLREELAAAGLLPGTPSTPVLPAGGRVDASDARPDVRDAYTDTEQGA